MAKERLQPISLHQEMQRSYLEYAMSVIVGRALPDVRDGLKPVQRRILFAMHELGLSPDRPYRKCARVVGDVLGKYHPHGDQAVYDALVRLVQTFASRYPVLDGHGNFGSVDDDPPAAMRYTETRLSPISFQAMLSELGENTVDFVQNFDGSQQEPTVLPSQLPFLLLNGCSGIAVGMATSIPPHNLGEIVDGLITLIRKPDIDDSKLLEIIPGPDFPTGGEILIGTGVKETYLKGRGSIPMRGVAHIEETNPGKGKHKRNAIVVTELPYQISKAGWIEKLADYVNESKIGGISDIRDESDREGMRVVVELRRDADPQKVLKDLHNKTSLQSNYGAILLALVNGQPQQLSLKQLLSEFINFRELTIIRRTNYILGKTKDRLEIVEGLINALKELQKVINLIQEASDASGAKAKLMVQLNVTEKQADAILSMPLRRLTGLEQESLRKELEDLKLKKKDLEILLKDRNILLNSLIKELKTLKKVYGNPRRTKLIEGGDELMAEKAANQRPNAELQRKQALAGLQKDGRLLIQEDLQVKIISPQLLGRLHLNEESAIGDEAAPAIISIPIQKKPKIIAITDSGKIALVKWEFAGQNPGSIEKFLPTVLEGEKIIKLIEIKNRKEESLGLLSSDGRFKRLPIEDVLELSGRAATILKLKDGVILKSAMICEEDGEVIIVSNIGRLLKLKVEKSTLPIMGKLAQGPITMKLFPSEKIIGAISIPKNNTGTFLVGSSKGCIKRIPVGLLKLNSRCCMGQMSGLIKESKKQTDEIIDISRGDKLVGLVSYNNNYGRLNPDLIEISNLDYSKNQSVKLNGSDKLKKIIDLLYEED